MNRREFLQRTAAAFTGIIGTAYAVSPESMKGLIESAAAFDKAQAQEQAYTVEAHSATAAGATWAWHIPMHVANDREKTHLPLVQG